MLIFCGFSHFAIGLKSSNCEIWLISACTYSGKWSGSICLNKDMRLSLHDTSDLLFIYVPLPRFSGVGTTGVPGAAAPL